MRSFARNFGLRCAPKNGVKYYFNNRNNSNQVLQEDEYDKWEYELAEIKIDGTNAVKMQLTLSTKPFQTTESQDLADMSYFEESKEQLVLTGECRS